MQRVPQRSLRGSIDELPVFAEVIGDYPVIELALITYKQTPDTPYKRQKSGGVIGRDSECEHIYFTQDLFLEGGRRLTFVNRGYVPEKIRIADLDNYEILKAQS